MAMSSTLDKAALHVDRLLGVGRQVWLSGAGISAASGIPLMFRLTDRVKAILETPQGILKGDTRRSATLLATLGEQMHDSCHVEHHLSQIGDLITLAERKRAQNVSYGTEVFSSDELRAAHGHIQMAIRHTIEYGYVAASEGADEKIGTIQEPLVSHEHHDNFIRSLFHERRAGLERRPAIRFFTTNYDTLLEDSLARCCIPFADGFSGGATAFWDPRNLEARLDSLDQRRHSAVVYKLHGSIDWVITEADVVMRVRTSAVFPLERDKGSRLLIYPQATKYSATQRDPFARLFSDFRRELAPSETTVLVTCGYSFGDDHINEEIDRAIRTSGNPITLLALCQQAKDGEGKLEADEGLPPVVARWLKEKGPWNDRVVVLGSEGFYHGSLTNLIAASDKPAALSWWTFEGISKFLAQGPEVFG